MQVGHSFQKGLSGESIAEGFLRVQGYDILERRYKTLYGEIDLIANYKNMIVCVEVKVRKSIGDGLHVVSPYQQRRVMDAYLHYIQLHSQFEKFPVRFDVIVCAPGAAPAHVPNAFGEDF